MPQGGSLPPARTINFSNRTERPGVNIRIAMVSPQCVTRKLPFTEWWPGGSFRVRALQSCSLSDTDPMRKGAICVCRRLISFRP